MFIRLFNFLVKRTYYGIALVIPGLIWAVLAAAFGGILILSKANFTATGTEKIFTSTLFFSVIVAVCIGLGEFGLFRLFGKKWENKNLKALNNNIIRGQIRSDVPDQTLLAIYDSFDKTTTFLTNINLGLVTGVIIIVALAEYLVSHQFTNALVILIGGSIAAFVTVIFNAVFCTEVMSSLRKECKNLLSTRNVSFKEYPLTDLKTKFRLFISLIVLILLVIFFLIYPPKLNLVIISLAGLIIMIIVINAIFSSFYRAFDEIKQSAKKLEIGEKAIFFSGSTDKEIIDLSKSLNKTAQNIRNYQKELEEAKTVLEIKVKSRTKELKELAQSLEEQVKQRTKELQGRVDELERFRRLTVGRELKMLELKKEIKELKEELEKHESH
ncbi:hypothetical protein KJA14_02365 [Patescibacteria group bacterium]|nr:hypothetical protein [Patescibacteria group bacterium]